METNNRSVESKVDQSLQQMNAGEKDEILQNFEEFKGYLGKRINTAEKLGLNEEQLAKAAEKVADYLAAHEQPRNSEEQLLQELWKVGTKEERHMLAHMLVRMAQRAN
ncbi:DUF3243 domain-containing protein [Paenibacillus sp. 1P07SE]|uniref:DUF3243 domain-containing protein n=1 Tax=Paenibacillus sp. 1P07SE TaxID=3132209 RepID=UPI0039A74B31